MSDNKILNLSSNDYVKLFHIILSPLCGFKQIIHSTIDCLGIFIRQNLLYIELEKIVLNRG